MKTKIFAIAICGIGFMQSGCFQSNLLVNGGFEKSPKDGSIISNGWHTEWYPSSAGAITTLTAAKKGNGLWIYSGNGNSTVRVNQAVNCFANKNYTASAYLRSSKILGRSWTNKTEAYVVIEFLDVNGVKINEPLYSRKMVVTNFEWQEYSVTFKTPDKATKIIFTIKLKSENGQSVLNVDDCSVVEIK